MLIIPMLTWGFFLSYVAIDRMDLITGFETLDFWGSSGRWDGILHEFAVKLSEILAALLKSRAKFALQEAILGDKEKMLGNWNDGGKNTMFLLVVVQKILNGGVDLVWGETAYSSFSATKSRGVFVWREFPNQNPFSNFFLDLSCGSS